MDWGKTLNPKQNVALIIWVVLFFDVFICNRPVWFAYVLFGVGLIVMPLLRNKRSSLDIASENSEGLESMKSEKSAGPMDNKSNIATQLKFQKGVLIIILILLGDLFLCRNERPVWGNILMVAGLLGACIILIGALELDKRKKT